MKKPVLSPKWGEVNIKLSQALIGKMFFNHGYFWIRRNEQKIEAAFGLEGLPKRGSNGRRVYALSDVENFATQLAWLGRYNPHELALIFGVIDSIGYLQLELQK